MKTCKLLLPLSLAISLVSGHCFGQWEGREELLSSVEKTFGPPPDATRLTPGERVWVDRKHSRVIVDGYIAIQEGQLEMFACPVFTKEHESVVAVFSKAATIHAGLLAAGAKTGRPVQWDPSYVPPSGSEIRIDVLWIDKDNQKQQTDARRWIRRASRDPAEKRILETNWVFAGSGFWEDPDTKVKRYLAESGDLICVSNFTTATLDIPTKSTDANAGLMFIANSEEVPVPGTPVRLVLSVVRGDPTKEAVKPTEPSDKSSDKSPDKSPTAPAQATKKDS
jgi:hypothetical protein